MSCMRRLRHRHLYRHRAHDGGGQDPRLSAHSISGRRFALYADGQPEPRAEIHRHGEQAAEAEPPGRRRWARSKSRAKHEILEMADELIELYAARQAAPGYAFSADTPWQRDFEDDFPYEETPDQLQCIEEIKQDMQQPHPMDRLLCGDVGYGKLRLPCARRLRP